MAKKVYVKVLLEVDAEGNTRPISISFDNGHNYTVDKLLDARMAASTKVGGQGMRYTCRIRGHEAYLFEDEGRWFVEGK